MKRYILLFTAFIAFQTAFSQVTAPADTTRKTYTSDNGYDYDHYYNSHGDSIWLNEKYYSPKDYPFAKAAYDKSHYISYFLPGALYTYYQPNAQDSLGTFSGITIEYVVFAQMHDDENHGPALSRMYFKLSILNSTRTDIKSMFTYSMGFDLSLERNPKRQFLIPFFGFEVGGLAQKQLGGILQFTPTFGMHLLALQNLYITVRGGYQYSLSNFDMLKGWVGQAGIDFVLW
jgi:hypothetical protein